MKTAVSLLILLALSTLAEARKPFCKTVFDQAHTMMITRQTDNDFEGRVFVPVGIPKAEWRLYVALIERARYHTELYQDPSAALDILEEQCPAIYRAKMLPFTCGNEPR